MNRTVKRQLVTFSILTVIGLVAMGVVYLRVPTTLGWNRTDLALEMPDTGGLYENANVTYLGTEVGKIDSVTLHPGGVRADFHVKTSADVPENVRAKVQSASAVGEQFIELVPEGDAHGRVEDDHVFGPDQVDMPQGVGPVLDQAEALLASVDDAKLHRVISEAFDAFHGTDRDLQSMLDSTRLFLQEAQTNSDITTKLIQDAEPVLDSQNDSAASIRAWTANLAKLTEQFRTNEPQLNSIMERGPDALDKVNTTLTTLQPTLPVLMANLVSVGEVGVTYNRSIEQILVLYPALVASLITAIDGGADIHEIKVDFNLQIDKTPPCTTGFIPAADRRSPADLSVPAQINGLYCRVPSDSTMAVRGARNYPCMAYPGRRGASPEQCAAGGYGPGDVLGSNPPSATETGPPDTAVHPDGQDPPGAVPGAANTPASYSAPSGGRPAMSAGVYDSITGEYVASDGKTYQQSDLGAASKVEPGATMTELMTNGVT